MGARAGRRAASPNVSRGGGLRIQPLEAVRTPTPVAERSSQMKNSDKTTKGGLSIQTAIKPGGIASTNQNARALKVRAGVKAGGLSNTSHSVRALKVRAGVKAGGLAANNHSARALKVRAG